METKNKINKKIINMAIIAHVDQTTFIDSMYSNVAHVDHGKTTFIDY